MARTPYPDADAEAAYQSIASQSSSPSVGDDMVSDQKDYEDDEQRNKNQNLRARALTTTFRTIKRQTEAP